MRVDAYITREMKAQHIPGLALGIVKDDRILYLKGYGRADPSGRPVTPATPFIIGSISKSFTALAVMQLVEAGKIELDAPVQRYIPSFRAVGPRSSASRDVSSSITVRHLLNQTSGLSQSTAYQTAILADSGDDALEKHARYYMEGVQLNRPVGQSYANSNGNAILLGLIVQRVSGQSYESYVQEHIFAPLSMHNSFVSLEEALQHGLATGYRWWFGCPLAFTAPYNRGDLPAGFLISSAEDMCHYLIAQLNGGQYEGISVLSPSGIKLTHTEPVPGTYAMGWYSSQVSSIPVIGHAGGVAGFQAHVWLAPEQRLGVVVLANVLSAIDAIPSPKIITTGHLASGVLSLAADQPLPARELSPSRLYCIVDGVVLLLSMWLMLALARVPKRYQRLSQRGVPSGSGMAWRATMALVQHLLWPGAVLATAAAGVPQWQILATMQPDLITWLMIVSIVVLLKGLVEIGLLFRIRAKTTNPTR